FFPFELRHGVGNDAGARLNVQGSVLDHGRADGDGGVHVAVEGQVADGTAVDAALDRLQFVDDFHGADFRRAAECSSREGGTQHVDRGAAGFQCADDVGDDVHDVRVALDDHFVGDLHRAVFAD